jgi:hypothetical protein
MASEVSSGFVDDELADACIGADLSAAGFSFVSLSSVDGVGKSCSLSVMSPDIVGTASGAVAVAED